MKKNKGFTLIELLVVIAIIGILSSVVLVSLNSARNRGADAKIKAQIIKAKDSAQLYFDDHLSYNGPAGDVFGICSPAVEYDVDGNPIDPPGSLFNDADSGMAQYTNLANYPVGTTMRCSSNGATYVMTVSLSTPGEYWCIDSSGASKEVSAADEFAAQADDATACI